MSTGIHLKAVPAALLALFLGACGGGGGGSSSSNNPEDPSPQPQEVLGAVRLSGVVMSGTSGSTASSAAAAATATTAAGTGSGLGSVNITAELYDDDADTPLLDTLYAASEENGAFTLPLDSVEGVADVLDRVELTFQKDGFVVGHKSVRFDGTSSELRVSTRLGPEQVATQTRSELAFTASGAPAFRFGVVRKPDGTVAAVAGGLNASIAAGEGLLDIVVPEAKVPDSVTAVTARMAHFDPSDQEQVQSFPGSFTGSGAVGSTSGVNLDNGSQATASAGEDEYRLISSVFAQVDLEDQDGNTLALSDSAAAAAGDNPTMYLKLPVGSYETITQDMDGDSTNGIDVPIYVYSGGWKYVGNGTLVQPDGAGAYQPHTTLPTGTTDLNLFVEITITDGNQWIQWINLDWPIQAGDTITTLNFCGTAAYADNNPDDDVAAERYEGYVEVGLPDGGYDWQYVNNGTIDFSIVGSTGGSFRFYIWNPRTYAYERVIVDVPSEWTEASGCIQVGADPWTLLNPRQYRLRLEVTREGEPAAGRSFYVEGTNFWEWVSTDSNGVAELSVPNRLLTVTPVANVVAAKQVFVNGAVDYAETADNGSTATLQFTLENAPPVIAGVYGPERVTLEDGAASALFVGTAYDEDSSDLSFSWSCTGGCGVTRSAFKSEARTLTFTSEGTYTWSVTATDSDGASVTRSGQIVVESTDKAPRIVSIARDGAGPLNCYRDADRVLQCTDTVVDTVLPATSYSVNAYDPDGGSILCNGTTSCSGLTLVAGENLIEVTDTDGGGKYDGAAVVITAQPDQPPEVVYAAATPTQQAVEIGSSSAAVSLFAYATDDLDTVTYQWAVEGLTLEAGPNVTIPAGTWAMDGTDRTITATLTVTAGADTSTTEVDFQIVRKNQAPVLTVVDVPSVVQPDAAFTLSATATDDYDTTLTYQWLVDGTSYSGASVTVPANTLIPGQQTASVTVTDADGATDTSSVSFRVNAAPIVESPVDGASISGRVGAELPLTAVVSDDVSTGLSYAWEVAGVTGSADSVTLPSTLSEGTYSGTLTVTDADGATTTVTFSVVISRDNVAPTIVYPVAGSAYAFGEGAPIALTAQAIDDVDASGLSYAWQVDGVSYTGQTLQIPAGTLTTGTYSGTLTVTDADNASTSVSFQLEVTAGNVTIIVE